MAKIEGSCLCGAVHYSSNAEPAMVAVCHCKHCQKQTGSAFSPLVAVPVDTLQINRDALSVYDDIGESGLPVKRSFCGKCGSPILSDAAVMPALTWIKAGTLDDTSWLDPKVHIWCDSAQPWTSINESATRFGKNPPAA